MFFINPVSVFSIGSLVLVAAAVIPALVLLRFIYKSDRLEHETSSMVKRLILMGVVSTMIAVMMERLGSAILGIFFKDETILYKFLLYFGVVGFSEEASKYTVLEKTTWRSSEFNCKFDAIVYSTTVALGFALWENIEYVLMYGFNTALLRAITAVPGHACFGVFMGVWYGLAKRCELRGDLATCKICRTLCVIMPAFIHGCYDFIVSINTSEWVFIAFIVIMFLVSYLIVKRLSSHDAYLE